MWNSSAFIALAYLTQFRLSGCNAQTNDPPLEDIVPKREVLYVGGQYKNVTVSQLFGRRCVNESDHAERCDEFHVAGYDRANLR